MEEIWTKGDQIYNPVKKKVKLKTIVTVFGYTWFFLILLGQINSVRGVVNHC